MFRKTNIWAHPLRGQAVRSSLFVRPCGLSPKAPLLPSFAQGLLSRLLLLLTLMFFLGQASSIQAQTFPVTSLVQVSNFSPQLEAYDDPGRVVVTLISTDERPEYEVLLRFTLSGPGFSIRTREEFLPFPVTLQRNVPLILTGAQLRDYFDPANLSFGGQSLENILAGGGLLTEGPVSLCVEAFDYNRFFDPPVSNTGCATGLMRLQRPPVLTEPGSEVIQSFPQQLRFQWQPQHAGFIARYMLEVYEDILPGMGDNLIIENTQPLLVKSSTVPFYLMTSFDPLLQVGSRYLVRVHAEDIAGQAIFLNNGWSDIYSFVYLGDEDPPFDCPAPSGFTGTALDPFSLQLNWQNDPLVASWLIVNAQNDSIALPATSLQQQFTNLTPEQEYSYQLCAICDDGSSNCQSIAVLLPADTTSGACGPALLAQSLPLDDASLLISWNDIPQATGFTLRWSAQNTISPGTPTTPPSAPASPNRGRRQTPSQSPGPPPASSRVPQQSAASLPAFVFVDSLNLPAGSIDAQIDELVIGTTYQFELCKLCPDGSLVCTSWTETFNGLDDDCITSLEILRTDSTATSLSLSWTFDPQDISADSTFTLIWQVSDHSLPADSAVLYYAAGSFTIDSLEAFRAYDLRICAECTVGQPACRELEPFGGCPAAYDPYLADIDLNNALIAWQPEPGDSLRLTNARLKPRVAIRWDSLTVGDPTYFHLNPLGLDSAQIAEALALNAGVTYIAQIQTQCTDSLWSDWSTPVLFNLNCAVADSLWLIGVSDSSALIAGLAHSNAIHYAFEYRRTDQQSWTVVNNLSSPLLDLQALRADTEYEVRMRYWCSQGVWSDYTLSFFFNTLPPCLPPARITVDPIFTDAAQLNWDTYQDAVQTEIRYRPRASGYFYFSYYPSPWQSAITPDSFQLLSTLQEGAAYDFQMRSDCAVNFSEWTALDQFNLLCSPPSSITVTDTTYESATVQLNGLPNGAQSTSLEYRELGDSIWLTASTTFTYASLQNLDDLTYYELRATATCASGETSPYSDTTQFRTPVKCLIPENLVASNLQPFSAQVDWDVTGTINEWEVLLYSPTQITPVSAPAGQQFTPGPASPSGGTVTPPPPGNTNTPAGNRRINQGRNNANSGATGSTPAANPGIGSVGTNPARATNITQNQPVPYAGWQRFTVTNPTKLFEQLAQNTEYKVVVRARCPEFGWTDYSDTLTFRTLTDCRKPYNLAVSEVYQTSVRTQWGTFNNYAAEYQAILESVQPIAIGGLIQTAPAQPIGPGNISNPGGGGTTPARGNNMNTARVGNVSPNPTMNSSISQAQASLGIYKDSLITPDRFAIFTGLQPNTEYRFRVRSRCDNFGWTDHSDWFLFRTDECAIPLDIVEEALDRSTMRISWTPSYGINDYELKYKLADDPGADWITHNTQDSLIDLTNLLSNQIYDYILTEKCQGGTGTNSAPQDSFLMERPSINNGLYVCGLETQVDLSNQVPLASLLPGDTIIAFDFPIVITMATGSAGYFSGMGDIRMPYFNKAKFSFEFDNIFVNDEYRMVGGYLEATGFGIEVLPPWADSLLSDILEVLELADSVLQQEQIGLLEDLMALGDNANLPPDLQQAIQDVLNCFQQASTQAQIDSCNVMMDSVLILVNDFLDELYEGDFQVVFKKDQNQQFGFDAKGTLEPESWYEKRTIASADYFLAYKSVKEGNPEMVDGVVMPPGVIDSVAFSQPSGTPLPVSITVDTAAITFVGQSGDDYFLVAEQVTNDSTPNHIAGLLSVVPYPELPLKVVLVPLSATAAIGVSAGTIQNDVRAILGQAVVNPTITLASAFSAPGYDGTLDAVGSGIFTNYSPEMNDIIDGYENGPGIDGDTYYLFLVDSFEVTSRAGFMPRGRQFGFIYMGNAGTGSALSRTIAHEIAHGAYVLEHTFAAHPGDLPQGSTNNLMDYNGGSHLYKWQWDLIHDPVNAPILPGDGSGESNTLNQLALLQNLQNQDSTFTFMSPAGKPITLPADVQSVTFNTGDNIAVKESCFSGFDIYPFGSLRGFTLKDGRRFGTFLNCNNTGNFYGYGFKRTGVDSFYLDTLSKNLPSIDRKVIYVVPQSQNNAPGWVAKRTTWNSIGFYSTSELSTGQYRAQGSRKDFDFVVTNLIATTGGEVISLQNNDVFTDDAKQLLAISAAWPGTSSNAMVYAYTHAHQMSEYPLISEICENTQLTGINYIELQLKLKKMYDDAEHENQTNPYSFNYNQTPSLIISKEEINAWQTAEESIYKRYSNFYQQTISQKAILDYPNNATGAAGLVTLLDFWKDYPCSLTDMTLAERLHILEVLQHADLNSQWLWGLFGDENQGLYNAVLSVTKPTEYADVLNLYSKNGYALYEVIHTKFDETAYDFFVGTLANMVISRRSYETQGFTIRNQVYNANGTVSTYYTIGVNGQNPALSSSSILHSIDAFVDDPQSYFSSVLGNVGNGFEIAVQTGIFHSTRQLQHSQGGPFDPVALKFKHDVTFGQNSPSPITVTAGQMLVLPLCLAELLFRNYRSAAWDRNFKSFITVVAIAGAAASIVFTGGTAAGVVFAVLATADAVTATAVYALSDDAYSWETTGQGSIDQSVHQTVDNISMIVGLTNIAGLVGYGGGKLIFNFKEIKAAVSNIRTTAPAKLANLQNELRELYRLIKQYGLNGITDPNLIRIENQLRAELAAMYLNELITTNVPATVHLRTNLYAVAMRNGAEIPLCPGEIANGLYHMRPNLWLPVRPTSGKMLEVTNVNYFDEFGNPQFGKLTFYEDAGSPATWRCFPETILVPHADQFSDFFLLFQQKGWNWTNHFTANARAHIQSLSQSERLALKNSFSNWPDSWGAQGAFSKIFDDLALNLHPNGFTNSAVATVVNRVTTNGLAEAIDDAIKFSADPALVLLKGQHKGLMTRWHRGTLSYEDLTLGRNQIRASLIDALPPASLIGSGGLPGATPSIVNKIVNSNLKNAMDDIIQLNANAVSQKSFINLRGQFNDLNADWNLGIISYQHRTIFRNQIRSGVIDGLALSGASNVSGAAVDAIRVKVISGNLNGALDDAFNLTNNPFYTQTKARYQDLMADWNAGILSYEDLTLYRNQVRGHFIEELPLTVPGVGGLTPPVIQNITNKVGAGNLRGAMDDAVLANTDAAIYDELVQHLGRYEDLMTDWNGPIMSYEDYFVTRNQITDHFIQSINQ